MTTTTTTTTTTTATAAATLHTPLCAQLGIELLGAMATDRGGRQGVSMNGAGNIAGLLTDVLPAATVVEQMAADAAARISVR